MDKKKKKTKVSFKSILSYAVGAIIGIAFLFISRRNTGAEAAEGFSLSGMELPITLLLILAALFLGIVLHIILHETGHLIAGLLSGYKFISFSIGSIMIIKNNDRLRIKRFAIAGVGQCLMLPPESTNNTYPFTMSYLCGGLMNFIAGGIFFALFLFLKDIFLYAGEIFIPLAGMGPLFGLLNILPLKIGGLVTDGHNIVSLKKSEKARHAHWLLASAANRISSGERAKNLPEKWFEFSENYDFNDAILANVATMGLARLIDRHDFTKARMLAERILNKGNKLIEVLKNETRCELLFLEILRATSQESKSEIKRLFTPELEKYIKASKTQLSKHRLIYAYEKLVLLNDEKAGKTLAIFNRACLAYPYTGDCESEKELIGIINDLAVEHKKKLNVTVLSKIR